MNFDTASCAFIHLSKFKNQKPLPYIAKLPKYYPYIIISQIMKQESKIGKSAEFSSCFGFVFDQNHTFRKTKDTIEKKTAFFLEKTKSFDSKDEVLAPLTLRFLEKRRRFPTVKTPSFSGRFSICLQGIEIQSFAQPSNTRKISSKFPSCGKFVSYEVKGIENG